MSMRYVPGQGIAVVTRRLALLVGIEARAAALRVWECSDELDLLTLLDALGGGSLVELPTFSAVLSGPDGTRAVARGSFVAEIRGSAGTDRVDGVGVSTWTERVLGEDVFTWTLSHGESKPGDGSSEGLPIRAGVVLADALVGALGEPRQLGAVSGEGGVYGGSGKQELVCREPRSILVAAPEPLKAEPHAVPASEDVEEGEQEEVEQDLMVSPQSPSLARLEQPTADATLTDPVADVYDDLFGATVAGRRPEDAAVREADESASEAPPSLVVAPPPFAQVTDNDAVKGPTLAAADFARLRGERRVAQSAAPAPLCTELVLSTGRTYQIEGLVLVGRAPSSRPGTGSELPQLVIVDEPTVSKTHLELVFDGRGVTVTDVSTNGTLLMLPQAPPVLLTKGLPTSVPAGAVLGLGEELTIEVVQR